MKDRISKIVALFLAFVVLLSTTSFTVDMHYCGDFLVDTGVFSKAETCGMEEESDASKNTLEFKKSCCSNEQLIVDGQEELRVNSVDFIVEKQQLFVIAFVVAYSNLFESYVKKQFPNKDYSPPNLIENTRVLHQVFII